MANPRPRSPEGDSSTALTPAAGSAVAPASSASTRTLAAGASSPSGDRGPTWSLERRLPLVIGALLGAIVLAFGAAAYREVRETTIARSVDRMRGLAREVASASTRTATTRTAPLRALAAHPAVVALVDGRASSAALADSARAVLRDRWIARDSVIVGFVLRGRDSSIALVPFGTRDAEVLATTMPSTMHDDTLYRSRVFESQGQVRTWTVFPVSRGDTVVGSIAELRRVVGAASTQDALRRLLGEAVTVYITDDSGGTWATVTATPIPAPLISTAGATAPLFSDSVDAGGTGWAHTVDGAGEKYFAVFANVAGSPNRLVLVQAESLIMARPAEFLRRMSVIALVLLVVGVGTAWLMSHHATRPLVRLRQAAEAMAEGDFSQRVDFDGSAETVAVANAFNTMAEHTGAARAILEQRNESLQRANEAKARFLAMMSHELRTPLNAIGGYADLLALGVRGPLTKEQLDDLERIRQNKNQLLTLIGDILQFSRLDAGQLVIRRQPVVLREQFAAVTDMLGEQYARKNVQLVVGTTGTIVSADPARLQQVLINLLSNALQATGAGGSVHLSASEQGAWVNVTVADTGVGIPVDMQEQIFEPFVQVDTSLTRRVGGTGLGLAIVRELTTAMGGSVSLESREGIGSVFTVRLPVAASASIAEREPNRLVGAGLSEG